MMNGKKTAAKKPAAKKYNVGGLANAAAQFQQQQSMKSSSSPQMASMQGQTPTAAQRSVLSEQSKVGSTPAPAPSVPPTSTGARKGRTMERMAKGGAVTKKKPGGAVAIMIAMPAKGKGKTKMAMGGCATKKK